jgi:hypothetical protein
MCWETRLIVVVQRLHLSADSHLQHVGCTLEARCFVGAADISSVGPATLPSGPWVATELGEEEIAESRQSTT